jgi:hypothetical protein
MGRFPWRDNGNHFKPFHQVFGAYYPEQTRPIALEFRIWVGVAKSFKVDTDTDVEVSKDELENIALESNRTIDINEFVPKADPRYLIRPYDLRPDGR